jgi:nucleoside-diphosphate-sugar epimerase
MNVGGGHRVSLSEAVALLGDVVGVTLKIHRRPVEAGDVRDTWADVGRAQAELSYAPKTDLAEGLRLEAGWLRAANGPSGPAADLSRPAAPATPPV